MQDVMVEVVKTVVVEARPTAALELVVEALPPPPPNFSPPTAPLSPKSAATPSPRPSDGSSPMLSPELPKPTPRPRSNPAETDSPSVADRPALRIVLPEGSVRPIPTPAPTPGSAVMVTRMQPLRMLPPFSQVAAAVGVEAGGKVMRGEAVRSFSLGLGWVGKGGRGTDIEIDDRS